MILLQNETLDLVENKKEDNSDDGKTAKVLIENETQDKYPSVLQHKRCKKRKSKYTKKTNKFRK